MVGHLIVSKISNSMFHVIVEKTADGFELQFQVLYNNMCGNNSDKNLATFRTLVLGMQKYASYVCMCGNIGVQKIARFLSSSLLSIPPSLR